MGVRYFGLGEDGSGEELESFFFFSDKGWVPEQNYG